MDTVWKRKPPNAFTLVEMLIVMGILGLLFALLMPGISAVRRSANRNKARQQMAGLETAILGFFTDYGRFPLQRINPLNRDPDEDSGNTYGSLVELRTHRGQNSEEIEKGYIPLIDSLRGINSDDNPRNNIYLNVSEQDFIDRQYVDPWGHRFGVVADWNMDGNVTLDTTRYDNDGSAGVPVVGGLIPNQRVAIVSWGGAEGGETGKHMKSWDP